MATCPFISVSLRTDAFITILKKAGEGKIEWMEGKQPIFKNSKIAHIASVTWSDESMGRGSLILFTQELTFHFTFSLDLYKAQ